MKKTFKRLGAALLAMAMAVSVLCTGALAVDTPTYKISANAGDNHSYSVYQIFTGDYSTNTENKKVLSNVKWGKNGTNNGTDIIVGDAVPKDVLDALTNVTASTSNKEKLEVIKKYVNVDGDAFGSVLKDQSLSVPAGYYLIKDSAAVTGNDAATNYIVEVGADVTIQRKTGVPEVDKKVNGKAADTANIGDEVEFKLFATLPNNYEDYSSYKLVFNDTLSAGLTLTDEQLNALTVEVYTSKDNAVAGTNGVELKKDDTNGYKVTKTAGENSQTKLEVSFADLKKAQQKDSETVAETKNQYCVVVTYKATLNENAVLGGTGNLNTVNLTYSNDPNNTSEGTTTDKEVPVYTFQMNVVKKDGAGEDANALAGAKFVLATKKLTKTENETTTDVNVITSDDIDTYKDSLVAVTEGDKPLYTVGGTSYEMTVSDVEATKGQLNIKGLKDGTYYLYETVAPDGYNKLTEPIKIEIKAGQNDQNVLDGTVSATVTSKDANGTEQTNNIAEKTGTDEKGILNEITVVNNAGSQLPSTGGMGTTLFYIIGGVLMAGAAVVLVIKKKRSSAE